MLTLKQAFSTAAALQSAKTQIKLCEACPMHSLHKLCERIEGTIECGLGMSRVCFGILTRRGPHCHWIVLCFTVNKSPRGVFLAQPVKPNCAIISGFCMLDFLPLSLFSGGQIQAKGLYFPQFLRPVKYVHSGNGVNICWMIRGRQTHLWLVNSSFSPLSHLVMYSFILKAENYSQTCLASRVFGKAEIIEVVSWSKFCLFVFCVFFFLNLCWDAMQ